jgi:hypothetical protein
MSDLFAHFILLNMLILRSTFIEKKTWFFFFNILFDSMIDKDAKVREMRRENLLLTSKIQLLENQMENLNERIERTLRERSILRRDVNSVRLDSNVSIGVNI